MSNTKSQTPVSVGAGIAIAAIWLAYTAVSMTMLVMLINLGQPGVDGTGRVVYSPLTVIIIALSPAVPGLLATKLLLGKDNE